MVFLALFSVGFPFSRKDILVHNNFGRHFLHLSPNVVLCRVGSVGSVSASRTVGREFASRLGHTKDHHKNGTNCLPA